MPQNYLTILSSVISPAVLYNNKITLSLAHLFQIEEQLHDFLVAITRGPRHRGPGMRIFLVDIHFFGNEQQLHKVVTARDLFPYSALHCIQFSSLFFQVMGCCTFLGEMEVTYGSIGL